jgi:glycosyltransferase involved in cell wall biosynthesis
MKPRLSVLLPYRDVEATIDEAIFGVLQEQRVPLELIAIDDGSRDGSSARVAAWAARDARVISIRGDGAGITRALSRGLEVAQGEWIGRMDGDDISLPGRFAAQVERLMREPRLGALGGLVTAFPEHVIGEGLVRYLDWQNGLRTPEEHARDLFVESPLCHPSVCIRRDALEKAGGYRDVPWAEDYDLWMRLDVAGFAIAKVDFNVLRWRHREGRLTFSDARYSLERYRELKAHFLAPRLHRCERTLVCWGAGPTGRRFVRALEREDVRVARFIDIDPRKIGRIARGAPITSAESLDNARDFVIVAVGSHAARALIREDLVRRGFIEREGFVCIA